MAAVFIILTPAFIRPGVVILQHMVMASPKDTGTVLPTEEHIQEDQLIITREMM
jgi:hypothetical protein